MHHGGCGKLATRRGQRRMAVGALPHTVRPMTPAAPAADAAAESDIVLRDGSTVHVRPTTPEDEPRLRAFFASLSDESRWFRYFSGGLNLDWAARNAAVPGDGLSLLALRGPEGAVVGHGTYITERPGRAEIAFAVADAWHGHGIATVLLAHLAQRASSEGIATFTALVMLSNHRMLQVFHDSGFHVSSRRKADTIEIEFPTSLSREARQRFEERQRVADIAAVAHVLRPASVAVIGASRREGTVGNEVVRNLLAGGFSGTAAPRQCARCGSRRPADRAAHRRRRGRRRARRHRGAGGRGARDHPRVRGQGRACARRADGRLRRGRTGGTCAPGRAARGLPGVRHADGRPELPRGRQPPPPDRVQRHVRPGHADARQRGLRVSERGVRDRGDRRGRGAGDRAVVVRLDGRQGRSLQQRPPRVLGTGPRHVGAPPLPRVVRQPAPVRADRAPDHRAQADRGGQERPHRRRPSRRVLPHRRPARGLRRDRRCAVRRRRGAARGDDRGDVRRRRAAGAPAVASQATAWRS